MALLVWGEKYSVQIQEIDNQHRKLIGYVNDLNEAMRQGKGKQTLEKVLRDLISYTRTHFANEERLMRTHGYPDYEEHKDKHDKMTQKVLDLQKQYNEGKITITMEAMNFLENWVDKHILGTDMKYAPFLNAKGIK